jgi:hemerythrin-like domain-containing protein
MLEDMYDEHRQVDALLAELAEVESEEQARATALRLVTLAQNHFAKEETFVFPRAEQTLGEPELVRLGEEWQYARLEAPFALKEEP